MPELIRELFAAPEAYVGGAWLLCALIGLGFAVGTLTGLFGVGGAFLVTPLLNVLLGIPYPVAAGSSLSYGIGAGATGLACHLRLRNVEVKSMLILAGGGIVGAFLGAMLHGFLDGSLGRQKFTLLMHGLFIAVLTLTGWTIFRGSGAERRGRAVLQRLALPPYVDLLSAGLRHVSLIGMVLSGVAIGVIAGLLGIGGGVLFMPVLILVVGLSPHQAVGTSLGVVLFSSISGTIKFGIAGTGNLLIVMALLVGSTVGVQLGASICGRLHGARLRRCFAGLVVLVAVGIAADFARKLLGK